MDKKLLIRLLPGGLALCVQEVSVGPLHDICRSLSSSGLFIGLLGGGAIVVRAVVLVVPVLTPNKNKRHDNEMLGGQ